MNEFKAKKLGEVVAFSRIGIECRDRAGLAFDEAFKNDSSMGNFSDKLREFEKIATDAGNDMTSQKAEKTTEKLRGMMEAYIGDEWDNSVEILEWLGFYFGAATVHWALVVGASSMEGDNDLRIAAEEAVAYNKGCLEVVAESLRQVGVQRVAAK